MRGAQRALAAIAAVVALVVLALAIALPRIAASDAVRARLVAAVQDATRREFTVKTISAGLFPPHIELAEPALAGDADGPSASARSAELRLAVLPLLARVVVVRSLVVEGASVHLLRDDAGVHLAGTDLPEPPKPERTETPDAEEADRSDGFSLAVQRVVLRDGAVRFDDRTRDPAARLELRSVELELKGRSPEAPVDVTLRTALGGEGTIALTGSGRRNGPFAAEIELRDVELAPFAPYAEGAELPGRIGGAISISGKELTPDHLKLALAIAEPFRFGSLAASGPVLLTADLDGDLRAPQGPFELDASKGELSFGSSFTKPRGEKARAVGRIRRERTHGASTLRLEAVDLTVGRVRARAEIELAPRREITLDAEPFAAEALGELMPPLAGKDLGGKIGLEALRVELEPLAVHGRIALVPLAWKSGNDAPIEVRGALEGRGDAIEGKDLRLSLGGESGPLTLRLTDLAGKPRFAATAKLAKADSSAVVAAFGGDRDRLSGPLDLDARLAGPLAGGDALLEALTGDVSFRIAPGRLKKVSLLTAAFAAAHGKGSDAFDSLSGRFDIAKGDARTENLRLESDGYTAELRGRVGLADRKLDLRSTFASERKGTIPLATVTGTLDAPEVAMSREALAGVAAAYAGDERRREKWERKLDKRLGEGEGKQVLEALDKVLQGMSQPKPAPEEPSE